GADLKRDDKTGYFQISRILKGADWEQGMRSPLAEIGVNVNKGDYIIAVNGRPANEVPNIYELLVNTVGKQITLKINATPEVKGSRNVTVIPTGDESRLLYHEWVDGNI